MFTSIDNDADFISFWRANTQFFAYYVILSRKYAEFKNNPELLLEYLQQRGLYICHDETLENLKYLMKRYHDEIRKRGTIQVINKRTRYDLDDNSDSNSSSDSYTNDSNEIDGELLRTICFDKCDEFIFNFRQSNKLGFNIGNHSPLYRGTSNMEGCNKIWTQLISSIDYLKYPLFGNVSSTLDEIDESDSDSFQLDDFDYVLKTQSQNSGFGLDPSSSYSLSYIDQYAINVNDNIDYEFEFRVKASNLDIDIFAGINAFDCDNNSINLLNVSNLSTSIYFVQNKDLSIVDKWYHFRGIIYNKNKFPLHSSINSYNKNYIVRDGSNNFFRSLKQVPISILLSNTIYWVQLDSNEVDKLVSTNWNIGNNLQFTDGVKKIIPFFKSINNTSASVYIGNIFLKPINTNYSSGFIQTNNWVDFWLKNNNQTYNYSQIKDIFRKYLLPYDTEFEINQLELTKQI